MEKKKDWILFKESSDRSFLVLREWTTGYVVHYFNQDTQSYHCGFYSERLTEALACFQDRLKN